MNVQDVLALVNYPTDYLVLDFESFYSSTYSLSKMSTIEYVKSELFECLGCGFYSSFLNRSWFYTPDHLDQLQDVDFSDLTVVVKNAKFDILVLQEIFGITPPYIIDVEDLSRHLESQDKHSLKHLAVKYKLGMKGRTEDFKGLHWADMDEAKRKALEEYCLTDITLEKELFELLLPRLSNPKLEVPLMRHTLDLFLDPKIIFDYKGADKLQEQMRRELNNALEKVLWVLDYEN